MLADDAVIVDVHKVPVALGIGVGQFPHKRVIGDVDSNAIDFVDAISRVDRQVGAHLGIEQRDGVVATMSLDDQGRREFQGSLSVGPVEANHVVAALHFDIDAASDIVERLASIGRAIQFGINAIDRDSTHLDRRVVDSRDHYSVRGVVARNA